MKVDPGYDVFCDEVSRDWHVQPADRVEGREEWAVDEFDSGQGNRDLAHLNSAYIPGTFKDVIDELFARAQDYRRLKPAAIPSQVAHLVFGLPKLARSRNKGKWAPRVVEIFLKHEKQDDRIIFNQLVREGLVSPNTSRVDFSTLHRLRELRA